MMGADSVAYHRDTIIERGDDFPGAALEYYATRGETPLLWGGSGAESLGLIGPVDNPSYDALYGPGGARHPRTGERMVTARRPGMELVIAAHKSVAELGVLGRAEDMHAIMDAERDATLAYLDQLTRERGGRRGVAAVPTATTGLVYAHARHATTRAGDPGPHDHVLIANVIEMLDARGGTKAPDTTLWREHLHAATMVGRVASAATAVQLGYGIEADPGPSGKLGHWKIAGIPDEALAVHSKRSAEISEAVAEKGILHLPGPPGGSQGDEEAEAPHVGRGPVAEMAGRTDRGRLPARAAVGRHRTGWPRLPAPAQPRVRDPRQPSSGCVGRGPVGTERDAVCTQGVRQAGRHRGRGTVDLWPTGDRVGQGDDSGPA